MRQVLHRWLRWFLYGSEDATYVRDIQVLKPEKPLHLPPVKELKARIVPAEKVKRTRKPETHVVPMRRQG